MTVQFKKYYSLTIGQPGQDGKRWTSDDGGLQITFEVERKGSRSNAKLRLSIFNLSTAEVGFVEQEGNVIILLAGYANNNGLLFSGTVATRGVTTKFEGNTRETTIEAGEAESDLQSARVSQSYEAGTSIKTVLEGIAKTLNLGIANIDDVAGTDITFNTGWTFFGKSRYALDEVVTQLGPEYGWLMQDGQIYILDGTQTLNQQAVLLRDKDGENTGLIGEPQRQKKGLDVKALMRPQLRPGRLVKIESTDFDGFYKINQAKHTGDYWGGDWITTISCREVG